jgi:arylsulfatase A-like enzyme
MEATDKYLARFANVADEKRRTYCAMMSAMDDAVGRVLAMLRAESLEDDTLIFFISDNGGPTWSNSSNNAPLRGVKATTWEGGIRVPFLAQWKGRFPAGLVYTQPVIQLDIVPTVLAAADTGAAADDRLEGVDLAPYFMGLNKEEPHGALFWRFGPQFAVRAGDWKLMRAADDKEGRAHTADPNAPVQLFNLADDVGERNDVAEKFPEKVAELQTLWDDWNKLNVEPSWPAVAPGARKSKKVKQN